VTLRAPYLGLAGLLASLVALSATEASAAGLYTADRGVRPLGRGGAFVAGADDLGAIWYNPAGLADAGSTIFIDLAWVNFSSEFTRKSQVTDASGVVRTYDYPKVDGTTPFLPIPTLGASYNFGEKKEFTIAAGIMAPLSPSRYSLVSLDGSTLLLTGVYFAYKPIEQIRIGIGLQALVGNFASRVVFSASPQDRLISSPEDPQYDSLSQLKVGPIVSPTGNLGFTIVPTENLRFGLSAQAPAWINAPATINVRLPNAAVFDKAYQDGDEARVRFKLPPILRAGAEYRTALGSDSSLRVEASYVRELWSLHESIDVRPENVKLYNITGFPSPFGVAGISLPRHFQDSNSVRLGGEYSTKALFKSIRSDFRAGVSYETSAIPNEWVSALTYDSNKVTIGAGASLHPGEHWRLDAVAALVLLGSETVDPANARVPRVNPVAGNPTDTEAINGGTYSARAIILGTGAQYKF